MNDENAKIMEASTTAAFMMKGLHSAGYDQCITEALGMGRIETVQEMVVYVPMIMEVLDAAECGEFEFPGVFDYEVSSPFGRWFGKQLIERGEVPSRKEAVDRLSKKMSAFFNQSGNDSGVALAITQEIDMIARQFIEAFSNPFTRRPGSAR